MAKVRIVNTRFWDDDYISHLDPVEKLLFLYFLTNPSTDICGIYEMPLKSIASDTGIKAETIEKIMSRFSADNKIIYVNGWVFIRNFTKHQTLNPKVIKGIELGLLRVPKEVMSNFGIAYPYSIDSLSHSNSNSNLNSNSKLAPQAAREVSTNDLLALFEGVNPSFDRLFSNKTQRAAVERLVKRYGITKVEGMIRSLPEIIKRQYAPVITTPIQLESKLGQLVTFAYRQKGPKATIIGL